MSRLVATCPFPLRLWKGRDIHPHQEESMPPLTIPCPPTSRFNQGFESKPYEFKCGDQSHQKFALRQICLRDWPRLDPLDQTGEESNLRLVDLPIPNFTWLLPWQPSKVRLDSLSKLPPLKPTFEMHID